MYDVKIMLQNDRPLPPKPPSVSQPKQSTAMPTKSRIKSRESGYGSVSSAHSQEDSRQSSRTSMRNRAVEIMKCFLF